MIKFEHVVLPSLDQMNFIIEGMRNPMNSWDKSDSGFCSNIHKDTCIKQFTCNECPYFEGTFNGWAVGDKDLELMTNLSRAGKDHRKYMRMIKVYVRITAPLYWWKEFDTYKVGTVANSCSTMHKITERPLIIDDFSYEHLMVDGIVNLWHTIDFINTYRDVYILGGDVCDELGNSKHFEPGDKQIWWQIIQLLPTNYNQTRNVELNYEVLSNIRNGDRAHHKLDEWRDMCAWIDALPLSGDIIRNVKERKE